MLAVRWGNVGTSLSEECCSSDFFIPCHFQVKGFQMSQSRNEFSTLVLFVTRPPVWPLWLAAKTALQCTSVDLRVVAL